MIFGFDEFELDTERLELLRAGRVVHSEALVLRLLIALVQQAGRIVTKEELIQEAWDGRAVSDNVLTVSMARLRKTLGDRRGEREFVVTVHRRGYRFVRDVIAREASAQLPTPAAGPGGPPFVGREALLTRLHHALGEARAGRGRACVLLGEPGIGKTRVVEAFERDVPTAQQRVVWGYCREAGDTPPLWPWLRLLRELIGAALPPEVERKLGTLAAEVRDLLRVPNARDALDAAWNEDELAGAARHRALDALLYALTSSAEQSPCVLVLDDLHRADAASLELLGLLLDEIAHTRILVIATLRHAGAGRAPRPDTHLPRVLGHRNCERVVLEPLREDEVAHYVSQVIEDQDGSLGRAVYAKSEGNPFFMTELLRQLEDGGQPDPASLALPQSALELMRARLSRLSGPTRNALAAASVIGRSFELPLLSATLGLDSATLMSSLDEALAAEVLVAARGSMTAFAFGHELLRSVLYDALSPPERRRWHLTVGLALEQRAREGDAVPPSELAYHFHAALPEGDLRKTVQYCRAAARASARVVASTDVVRYGRHAIEALDLIENSSQRLRAHLLLMIALYSRGHASGEFTRVIREVARLARERGDGALLAHAASTFNAEPGFAPLPGAAAALEHALQLLPPDDKLTRAVVLAALACATPRCFSAEACEPLIAEAEALARESGAPVALQVALRCKLYVQGGPNQREVETRTALELEQLAQRNKVQMPVVPLQLSMHRALIALQQGDAAQVSANLARGSACARTLRHNEFLWHSERYRAVVQISRGELAAGAAQLRTLHREARERAILGTAAFCAFDRTAVFGEAGEAPELDDDVRRALEFDPSEPPSLWSLKLRALSSAGLVDEARALLRALTPAEVRRLPCDSSYLGTLGHLARAALALGALDYAEVAYELLSPYPDSYAAQVSFLCEGAVPQLLGMLSSALGRPAAAVAQLERGLAMNVRAGLALRAAETQLQLARCVLDAGSADRKQRALRLAGEAGASATQLGLRRLAQEAGAVATRAGG